jgi:hypothetical protein
MSAFHFGPASRRLFGVLHDRETGVAQRPPVLLAAPFGHEAIRSHRFYRILADRLARAGHPVLRFDYFGTGDSDGDDADVRLSGWAEDIQLAHLELARRCGQAPQWWMGARLGASAALQAWHQARRGQASSRPRLLLWDPVVDGAAYLQALRIRHVEALEASFSVPDPQWRRDLAKPEAFIDEAIGFAIPVDLRHAILNLSPEQLAPPESADLALVLSPDQAATADWATRAPCQPPRPALRWLDTVFDWTSDDSLNTALVPAHALNQILRTIDDAWS